MVKVLAGASKGKTGRVLRVLPKTNRAVVEGVNMESRHTKPTAKTPNGEIINTDCLTKFNRENNLKIHRSSFYLGKESDGYSLISKDLK